MQVGILGSGLMGGKLGTIFARAGHGVVFSYARSDNKLKTLARDAKGNARVGTPGEALFGVGGAALLLLFTGTQNSWDSVAYHALVTRAKERHDDAKPPSKGMN